MIYSKTSIKFDEVVMPVVKNKLLNILQDISSLTEVNNSWQYFFKF